MDSLPPMKRCSYCKEMLPVSQFNKLHDGYAPRCKPCRKKTRNQEKDRAYTREYREKNLESVLAKTQHWREKNKEQYQEDRKASDRKYYLKWRDRKLAEDPEYFKKAHARIKENDSTYLEKMHGRHLQRRHNVSLSWYQEVFEFQRGVCALCGEPETERFKGSPKRLTVDHCHLTGNVRALLCRRCNFVLGLMKDNTALLQAAIVYLEHFRTDPEEDESEEV